MTETTAQSNFIFKAETGDYERKVGDAAGTTDKLTGAQKKTKDSADQTSSSMDKLGKALDKGRDKFNTFAKYAGAAGIALTTALVKSGLQSVDTLAKTSDKLGITTDKLAQLRFAAEQTGVSAGTMDIAMQRFTRRLADAAAGTGPAVKAFQALGLSAQDLVKLSPDEALKRVADQMNKVENQSQKVSLAFKLFDSEGVGLVNTLKLGSSGLEELARQADAAGVSISRFDAAKVEAANDAVNRVKTAFTGFTQQLAIQFAPVLVRISDYLFGVATEAGGMASIAGKAFDYIVKAVGVFADGLRGLEVIFLGIKAVVLEWSTFILGRFDSLARGASELASLIPGVDIDYENSAFAQFYKDLEQDSDDAWDALHTRALDPLPSQGIETFVDEAERQFDGLEATTVESMDNMAGGVIHVEDVTKALATTTKKKTKEVESAWDKAITGMVERIDNDFANAWKDSLDGNFDSFKDFTSNILDASKTLFAELLHLNITRPLVQGVAGMFGLGTTAGAAASTGGNIFSGISAAGGVGNWAMGGINGALAGVGGAYTGVGSYLSSLYYGNGMLAGNSLLGNAAMNSYVTGAQYAQGGWGALGYGAANIGAGFLGSYAGGKVFGDTSGIGSAAGGAVGSIWGPVGTAIGSFVGSGIERGLGNVFGFGGSGQNDAARSDISLGSGLSKVYGVGKKFDQSNVDAAQALTDAIQNFAGMIGGSNASFNLKVGSRSGIAESGQKFNDVESFLSYAFDKILQGATNLDSGLKALISSFNGTTEELGVFTAALLSISEMIKTNPVQTAIEDFKYATEGAGRSITASYYNQLDALSDLIAGFDGSAQAAAHLSDAMTANRATAYQLAQAILATSDSIASLFTSSANRIRESVLTEDQLYAKWERERDQLRQALGGLLDPAEIQSTAAEIERLNTQMFNSLSEDAQLVSAEMFAKYADETSSVAQRQLQFALDSVEASQTAMNATIGEMLAGHAETYAKSAQDFKNAVDLFVAATEKQAEAAEVQDEAAKTQDEAAKTSAATADGLSLGGGYGSGPQVRGFYNYLTGEYDLAQNVQTTSLDLATGITTIINRITGEILGTGTFKNGEFVEVNV